MSQWREVQILPQHLLGEIFEIYKAKFLIEIRSTCAEWIENKPWTSLDSNTVDGRDMAISLVTQLIREIKRSANNCNDFALKLRLHEAATYFQQQNTLELFND